MNIFDKDNKNLVALLTQDPLLYVSGKSFLETLKSEGVFNLEIEKSIDESIRYLNDANHQALNSKYFIFKTYDSCAEKQQVFCDGYSIFFVKGDTLERVLGVDQGPPSFDDVTDFLKTRRVSKLFTAITPYKNVFPAVVDENDGEIITYECLKKGEIASFKNVKIKIISLE